MAFNQNTTPSALDQLIRRAKNESSVHTFSRSFDTDPTKVTSVTKLFRSTKQLNVRMGALSNPELVTQFLFVLDKKIFPLTRPCITSEEGDAVYVGSMSDELGECIPIQVSAEGFAGWFTSIVPQKDADDYNLPYYLDPPDTIEGRPSTPGAYDGEAGSFDCLNLGPNAAALDPTITVLPMVLPVPGGVPLPTDTWEVNVPNPEMMAIFPFVEVWRKAHHYIIDNNEGWSVTVDGPLFDQSKIVQNQTPANVGVVQPRGALTLKMLAPTSPLFTPVKTTTREATNAAYIRIGSTMAAQSQHTATVENTGMMTTPNNQFDVRTNSTTGDSFERFVNVMASSARSPEVTERNKTQEKVVHRYMLAFATIDNNGGENTVIPAKLKPGFIELIKCTNLSSAKSGWSDILTQTCQAAGESATRLDGGATIQADDLSDGAFVAALREFKFLRKVLNSTSAMNDAKTHISILAFATPIKDAKTYKDRLTNEQLITCQEAVGEEKTKIARKATELYNGGALFHVDNVKTLIYNLRVFGLSISDDFENSEFWKNLRDYEMYLHSKPGREWAERLSAKYKHAALIMAIDLHNIIRQYFSIGDNLEYRSAMATREQVHPKVYHDARAIGNMIVSSLYTDIGAMRYKHYEEIPDITPQLPHLNLVGGTDAKKVPAITPDNVPISTPGKHHINGPDKEGNNSNEANKRGRTENKKTYPHESREVEKTLGFLTWTGTGAPPKFCPVFVKTTTMKTKERICLWHCIHGFFCGRGKDKCRQGHIQTLGTLCPEEQKKMEEFVNKTKDLDFVTGQGPKGMD